MISQSFFLTVHFDFISALFYYCRIQDIAILFNVIIILLMMFNTYVFQVGLLSLLLERFRALLILSAVYLTLSICLHCWLMVSFVLCFSDPETVKKTKKNKQMTVLNAC